MDYRDTLLKIQRKASKWAIENASGHVRMTAEMTNGAIKAVRESSGDDRVRRILTLGDFLGGYSVYFGNLAISEYKMDKNENEGSWINLALAEISVWLEGWAHLMVANVFHELNADFVIGCSYNRTVIASAFWGFFDREGLGEFSSRLCSATQLHPNLFQIGDGYLSSSGLPAFLCADRQKDKYLTLSEPFQKIHSVLDRNDAAKRKEALSHYIAYRMSRVSYRNVNSGPAYEFYDIPHNFFAPDLWFILDRLAMSEDHLWENFQIPSFPSIYSSKYSGDVLDRASAFPELKAAALELSKFQKQMEPKSELPYILLQLASTI